MREIKFRGTDVYTGEKRYGFYLEDEDGANILDIKNISRAYLVDRDSVAQLVGHDANGEEIYEGDVIVPVVPETDKSNREHQVMILNKDGEKIWDSKEGKPLKEIKAKFVFDCVWKLYTLKK